MNYFRIDFLFSVLLGVLLVGCASVPPAKKIPAENTLHTIYFIYRGWHTSILLDAKALLVMTPQLAAELDGQKYVRIGWGDGDYFTGKNKSTVTAAKALLASGYSAVQLLTYDGDPFSEIPLGTLVPLLITDEGLNNLLVYLNHAIALDPKGKPVYLPASGDAMGTFFKARDHYSAFSNCNTWSGSALRAAGLPITNRLTSQGVFEQAKFISQWQAEHGLFNKQ